MLQVLFCSPIRPLIVTVSHLTSLRSKRFQTVSEQTNRAKNGASIRAGRGFARPKPKIPCVPRSFTRKSLLHRLHLTNGVITVLCFNFHISS